MDRQWAAKVESAADPTAKLTVAYDYMRATLSSAEKKAVRSRRLDVIERLDHARLDAADLLVALAEQVAETADT